MITAQDVLTVGVGSEHMALIIANAKKASLGGVSRIRGNSDRQAKLYEDQLVGQMCHAAGSIYLTGSINAYVEAREEANLNPHKGDDGKDIPRLPIDIKGSLMRAGNDPLDYRLLVRPRERHKKHFYVLALLEKLADPALVYLVGWARDEELPEEETDGPFKGAHLLYAENLHSMRGLGDTVQRIFRKRAEAA